MAVEKDYGVRLGKLRFGVIHKKVGPFQMRNEDCGLWN